jgi:hypothetical protein
VGESADVIPVYLDLPVLIAYLRQGQTESGWMQYMIQNAAAPPNGLVSWEGFQGALSSLPMMRFLWYRSSIPAVNYTSVENPYYVSGGQDNEIHWRSDWTPSALKLTYTNGSGFLAGHHSRNSGGITLTRGADYGLINAGFYQGNNGHDGGPSPDNISSDYVNTLHFDDSSPACTSPRYMYGYNTQQNWATWNSPINKVAAGYAYGQNEFTYAYDDKPGSGKSGSSRTLRYFFRSVGQLGNTTFVFDRAQGMTNGCVKKLYWYFSPITAQPTLTGSVASAVVGSSQFFVDSVLPSSPTLALVQGSGSSSYRLEIQNDSDAATNFLTVLWAGPSGAALPTVTTLVSSGNAVAAQIADTAPEVFVHANVVTNNGNNTYTATPQNLVTFTSTHAGTGSYLIGGLAQGVYIVMLNGALLPGYNAVPVAGDGTLTFSSTSGTFLVSVQGNYSPCDLNLDGVVNNLDFQISISQALGVSPCTNGDLDGNGVCNVVDVQRVSNAASQQSCRVGP